MAGIFNRAIFNDAIFNTAQTATAATTQDVGGVAPWKQRWRQELVEMLAEVPVEPIQVPAKAKKAIKRVFEKAPPDDAAAIRALRNELAALKVPYKPAYVQAMRQEIMGDDEEEVIALLLLH